MTPTGGVHFLDAAAPYGMRLYAIGDVHGRLDCLAAMHALIEAELARDRPADWRIVHLGDYVDRGPQAAQVLDFLAEATARDSRVIALRGNHDEGVLDFLADPPTAGLFLDCGGSATAASYGVVLDMTSREALMRGRDALAASMPPAHLRFLRNLPCSVSFGDFFFCHAGIRPGVPLDEQDPRDLIWIRGEFTRHPHLHGKVIVHGHTPHHEPEVMGNRVNVDTMAFETGRLTALVVDGSDKRFLEARA